MTSGAASGTAPPMSGGKIVEHNDAFTGIDDVQNPSHN
jgi:hypothetical protein